MFTVEALANKRDVATKLVPGYLIVDIDELGECSLQRLTLPSSNVDALTKDLVRGLRSRAVVLAESTKHVSQIVLQN